VIPAVVSDVQKDESVIGVEGNELGNLIEELIHVALDTIEAIDAKLTVATPPNSKPVLVREFMTIGKL